MSQKDVKVPGHRFVKPFEGPLVKDWELSQQRPPVPGEPVEYIYMPARGYLSGRVLKKDQVIRVIDLEGLQCFDCIMWDANDCPYNAQNCMVTMLMNDKWDKWEPGDVIYSKKSNELAFISEDTSDGTHFVGGAFCNEPMWRAKFGISGQHSCHDNFVASMRNFGLSYKDIDWGSCISYFMDTRYNADGSMEIHNTHTKAGDYIDLMAQMDIIVACSNCPDIAAPVNAYDIRPMMAVIFNPNEEYKKKAYEAYAKRA